MDQQDASAAAPDTNIVDNAVAAGGAYEIIRKRLLEQGNTLDQSLQALNHARLAEFGNSDMSLLSRVRVRTENNCVARDIVQVGEHLLFGYNVFIGLKKETKIDDVFALFSIVQTDEGYDIEAAPMAESFLSQSGFVNDFEELYRYYKHTRLLELTINNGKLLAAFQIGERLDDIRVFRWGLSPDGKRAQYIDNRGERDIALPPTYDFEWTKVTREDTVNGRHPHANILDTVFVETIGGDLTIKIENNTEAGYGIYSEPVDDKTQSLDDADIAYAAVGDVILLKVLPYREQAHRYFIYNTLTESVLRVDAIGESCVQLPEDHGLIFPGGYYLQTGEYKAFDDAVTGLRFKRSLRSPNGEDVLYVFYEREKGLVGLFAYNLIQKKLQNPIFGHGYAMADDGRLVIFTADNEPTRVHPMQIWQTPYQSAEFASKAPASQTFFGRIGNAELVRGISDLYSISRLIANQAVSLRLYEGLSKAASKVFDDHFWLQDSQTKPLADIIKNISATAELVIDEFEKVESIRKQSAKAMREAEHLQQTLINSIRSQSWESAEQYAAALGDIRRHRGHIATIKEYRYIDLPRLDAMDTELNSVEASLSADTVNFLANDNALDPYYTKISALSAEAETANTNTELTPLIETFEQTSAGLDLLSELMSTLKIDDTTVRTQIIDAISLVYAKINQAKAGAQNKRKNLGATEAIAEFGAQFKLFSQTITNALSLATTPEKCDEQLSRLLVQLEELESRFSDYDQFINDMMVKREEIYESFEGHKQQLLDARQRKAQSLADAAERILNSIEKRSQKFNQGDELNTYFASDALVSKIRDLVNSLRELDSAVKADNIESRLKAIKEQALRSLRDKTDIFESGGNVIKLGPRHRFSVNTQELDLTIIPRGGELNFHLTGTNYYEAIDNAELQNMQAYWDMALESETPEVYRAEYLAALIMDAAQQRRENLSAELLANAVLDETALSKLVREFATPRYKEGYENGIHDHDAALLIKTLLPALDNADLLRFDPLSRGLAQIFWANIKNAAKRKIGDNEREQLSFTTWPERAQSAAQMQSVFASNEANTQLAAEVRHAITDFIALHPIPVTELDIRRAADYLVAELGREKIEFITSKYATQLVARLKQSMDDGTWRRYQMALEKMIGWPAERWNLSVAWFDALINSQSLGDMARYIPEAVALINADVRLDRRHSNVDIELHFTGLLGDHPLLNNGSMHFALDSYLLRIEKHRFEVLPAYQRYLALRQQTIIDRRKQLRLSEFKPRPLSSFVRNRLINESYLPIIGDNLAKQMGTVGDSKRTDLMGLLMMISPPGYGKTTLMEYVANRLGLIFMKINCPSLGHNVLSLDPSQASNATARQELHKLNLGLEMGNNVMLYLDDIQHTNAEFLQKFISLCDGTRRIEGVWKGEPKTYDMRGRKFCVVMAGNPYTESGEAFKVPDMLANRADIYNLGDILGGMDEQFALSYIENALTSNPALAPLATRDMADVYRLVAMARGESVATTELNHQYSGAEINEIIDVLKKMFVIRDVILKINQQYIASAAQDDKYRVEPSFKLQGSYRNMNKMAEKISAVMNQPELMQMISDHYLGEAQLLTTGAEANLLKLAQLRGNMTQDQEHRWVQIKTDFLRNKAMGGDDVDIGGKVVAQLLDLSAGVQALSDTASQLLNPSTKADAASVLTPLLDKLALAIESNKPAVNVINEPVPGLGKILSTLADTIEHTIAPLVRTMDKKLDIDLRTHEKMKEVSQQLRKLEEDMGR